MIKRRAVVVTGASTGIGRACARVLIERGYAVFGSVRREADAKALRDQLGEHAIPLRFDVTDREAIAAAAEQVQEAIGSTTLAGLVNNAGVAVPGPLMHLDVDELRQQLDVNVVGLVAVTQALLPLLGARRRPPGPPGRIVNIGSISGRLVVPFLGAYAASKHAVEALSDALRRELLLYGIEVAVVEPGAVRTPIWDKAEAQDVSRYEDTDYGSILGQFKQAMVQQGRNGLPVSVVTDAVLDALTAARPKTRYPIPNRTWMGWRLPRLLPDRWVDQTVAKQLGLRRPDD